MPVSSGENEIETEGKKHYKIVMTRILGKNPSTILL
jgi:hypothetical protein